MNIQSLFAASVFVFTFSPAMALDLAVGSSASVETSVSTSASDLSTSVSTGLSLDVSTTGAKASGDAKSGAIRANVSTRGAGADAKVRLTRNYDAVIRLVEEANYDDTTFALVSSVSGNIYQVSAQVNTNARAALDAAIEANKAEIADLHAAIAGSAAVKEWIEASGRHVGSVIAVGLKADGSLAVFTR